MAGRCRGNAIAVQCQSDELCPRLAPSSVAPDGPPGLTHSLASAPPPQRRLTPIAVISGHANTRGASFRSKPKQSRIRFNDANSTSLCTLVYKESLFSERNALELTASEKSCVLSASSARSLSFLVIPFRSLSFLSSGVRSSIGSSTRIDSHLLCLLSVLP